MADEKLVTLIARALKAGIIEERKFAKTIKGCPKRSPMILNIVFNELDQGIEKRGHRYYRWEDDFLISTKTERVARRVMQKMERYLEEELTLK